MTLSNNLKKNGLRSALTSFLKSVLLLSTVEDSKTVQPVLFLLVSIKISDLPLHPQWISFI